MDPLDELKQLVYVAQDHSRDSQLELLWRITDVLLKDPDAYSDHQRICFGEIIEKLAYDLEQAVREELSRKVAPKDHLPHHLVRRLAEDEIAVARPVIEQSPVLTEDDLVEITAEKGNPHRMAVTRRGDIGERLSDALVAHGDEEVLESLTRNRSAAITPETVGRIADRAGASPGLQNALIGREDIPQEIMIVLLDEISEKMRSALEGEVELEGLEALEEAVDTVKNQVAEGPKSRAEQYVEELARQGTLNETMLLRFLYEDRAMEFLVAMARLCKMDAVAMEHVLADSTGRTLIIVCRAQDFSLETFKAIANSSMCSVPSDIEDIYPLTRIYRHFTRDKAQRAMRFLRMRVSALAG